MADSVTSGPVIRDIGDTARWAAVYRARETERTNRLFEDPFARQLAGARGAESEQEVGALASDLSAVAGFDHGALELVSPGLLHMLQKRLGPLQEANVLPKFAPSAGPHFFEPWGWRPAVVRSLLKTAARLKRLSFPMRLMALLPESSGAQGSRPWQGVCLLERARDAHQPSHRAGQCLLRLV